jgi:hypothetical protein
MKLKRSSTATDFDALADIEGDVDPLSPAKLQPVLELPIPPFMLPARSNRFNSPQMTRPSHFRRQQKAGPPALESSC